MPNTKETNDSKTVDTAETKTQKHGDTKNTPNKNTQTIAIAVLATALACCIITFAILLCTGVIKFDNGTKDRDETTTAKLDGKKHGHSRNEDDDLIDNPNPRVTAKGNLVEVDDLEFYLPSAFKEGGKNKDGAYTFNLENDDGWAQVLVYAERSSLSPEKFLNKISSYLDITDDDYEMNGTEWVQAENASALAYATKLDGKIYAVYYSVKLDSDTTGEAMQMIPKTLYMKKIERE